MDGTVQHQTTPVDAQREAVIRVRGLRNQFGPQVVHDDLNLDVWRGEVLGIVGGSGTGKSVLLRTIVGLNTPAAGSIEVLGVDVLNGPEEDRRRIERHWGVAFQDGALFSSLTVLQNVMAPLREHTGISERLMESLGALKISLVGLPQLSCGKFPSELSGGMRKRAALARACRWTPRSCFWTNPPPGWTPSVRLLMMP